jgi:glycosyltransferase involved in cell wall biosynthesis
VKIGIDMLADQSSGRARGTGRYARGLVGALLAQPGHEFTLYYYDRLPRQVEHVGGRLRELPAGDSLHLSAARLVRDNPDQLDLLLLTCPLENFQGYLPPFPALRGPKLAAILYDLIPLRFPEHYLAHHGIAQSYRRALAALRQYDLLLAISESARRDAVELLGVAPERVVNIGAGSDDGFFCPATSPAAEAGDWLAKQGIHQPFVYGLTALDYRKNLAGLLAAFERLPRQILESHQFVVTCATESADEGRRVREAIDRSAVASRLVLTGRVDDPQLRTLYQHATAFVFPSLYEGFGLPLVEAMQCGAAVIAGDNSSQAEVVGDAALLAKTDDANDLAAKITRVLQDRSLAGELRSRAVRRAARFTWQGVGDRCRRALDVTLEAPRGAHWLKVWAARGRLALTNRLTYGPLKTSRPIRWLVGART